MRALLLLLLLLLSAAAAADVRNEGVAAHLGVCPSGMCFLPETGLCFRLTSYECGAPRPTPRPTTPPISPIVESAHPVKLTLNKVPKGYRMDKEVISSILRWTTEMLKRELVGTGLALAKVEYAGRLMSSSQNHNVVGVKGPRPEATNKGNRRLSRKTVLRGGRALQVNRRRRLDAVDIALRVTVRGPEDEQQFALSYIMERIREEFQDLAAYLKKNGGTVAIDGIGGPAVYDASDGDVNVIFVNPFDGVEVGADSFDFGDIVTGATDPPSRRPTPSPAEATVVKVNDGDGVTVVLEDNTATVPWWAWLVLVLVLLILCLCCVCGCAWRRKRHAKREEAKQEQALAVWMSSDHRKKRASVANSKRARRTSGPPASIDVDAKSKRTSRRVSNRPPPSNPAQQPAPEANRRPVDIESVVSDLDLPSVDPPEELALVPYSSNLVDPNGQKAPRVASMYAADVYYGGNDGTLDGSYRTRESKEPGGAKISRAKSVFAEDVYYVSSTNEQGGGTAERKKKRKKKKTKAGKARRRRSVTERLRSSLRASKPQDVQVEESVAGDEDKEVLCIEDGKGERNDGDNGSDSNARYNESCATMSAGEHEPAVEPREASRKKGKVSKRAPQGSVFASFTRRISWKHDAGVESEESDGDGSGGSLGISGLENLAD